MCWMSSLSKHNGKFSWSTLFFFQSSSSVALQPGVGLRLLYNTPPGLSIPCSVSPFLYPHLSQIRGHVIQPSHFWSSSSSCCIQLSVQHLFGIAVSCILSMWPSHRILWHLLNLTMLFPLTIASNSSFRRILHNSFSFTGPYIFRSIGPVSGMWLRSTPLGLFGRLM